MKQGISLFSFTDSTDVRWMFEHAKKAGYDGVEPVMSENGYLNPSTPEKDILAMRRMAEDMDLLCAAFPMFGLPKHEGGILLCSCTVPHFLAPTGGML